MEERCRGYRWTDSFLLALLLHEWPGNVGELADKIDLAKDRAGSKSQRLTEDHLDLPGIVEVVREMDEKTVLDEILGILIPSLEQQGFKHRKRGIPLAGRVGEILGMEKSKVTRILASYGERSGVCLIGG